MLIESIPNVSEGRRPQVVARLAEVVAGTPGVTLLDRTSDSSHHRSVLTFAGSPEGVAAAVLALFEASTTRYREAYAFGTFQSSSASIPSISHTQIAFR